MQPLKYDEILENEGLDGIKKLFVGLLEPDWETNPIKEVLAKADGSLVTSFVEEGTLFFKSKTSIYSDQADGARQIIQDIDHEALRARLIELYEAGFSVNFEYVGLNNRIVLIYEKRALVLLNVINRETGEYVPYSEVYKDPVLRPYLIERFDAPEPAETEDWIQTVRDDFNIEGYVFATAEGQYIKIKTDWYVALHATKASIESDKNLFQAITNSSADDLKSLFSDEYSLNKINAFEKAYIDYLNTSINTITVLTNKLSGKDRKNYAIDAQSSLSQSDQMYLFGLVMKSFDQEIELEDLTASLTDIFNKYYIKFIPEV